jgi:hypothetical protein
MGEIIRRGMALPEQSQVKDLWLRNADANSYWGILRAIDEAVARDVASSARVSPLRSTMIPQESSMTASRKNDARAKSTKPSTAGRSAATPRRNALGQTLEEAHAASRKTAQALADNLNRNVLKGK